MGSKPTITNKHNTKPAPNKSKPNKNNVKPSVPKNIPSQHKIIRGTTGKLDVKS